MNAKLIFILIILVLCSSFAFAGYLESNCIYWNMTIEGSYVYDHLHRFPFTNSAGTDVAGVLGRAVDFNNNAVLYGGNIMNITTQNLSICLWTNVDSFTNSDILVRLSSKTAGAQVFQYGNTFAFGDTAGFRYNGGAGASVWKHICYIRNNSEALGMNQLYQYINNVRVTGLTAGTFNGFEDDATNTTVGAHQDAAGVFGGYLDGKIDELWICDVALEKNYIYSLFDNYTWNSSGEGSPSTQSIQINVSNQSTRYIGAVSGWIGVNFTSWNLSNTTVSLYENGTKITEITCFNKTSNRFNITNLSVGANWYTVNYSHATTANYFLIISPLDYENEISCYGDSITLGDTFTPFCSLIGNYLLTLPDYAGIDSINEGRSSTTLADWPSGWSPRFIELYQTMATNNSRIYLLQPNTNDLAYARLDGEPSDRYYNNFSVIMSYMKANMTNTRFIMTTQVARLDGSQGITGVDVAKFNEEIRQIAILNEVPLVEMTWAMNYTAGLLDDQLHLNQVGHNFWNRTVIPAILNPTEYTMTRDLFDIYHSCNIPINILNYSIFSSGMNCLRTTAADWLIIKDISITGFNVTKAPAPFVMNISEIYLPNQNYSITYNNGTSFNVTTTALGSIENLSFGAGNYSVIIAFVGSTSPSLMINMSDVVLSVSHNTGFLECTGYSLAGDDIFYNWRIYRDGILDFEHFINVSGGAVIDYFNYPGDLFTFINQTKAFDNDNNTFAVSNVSGSNSFIYLNISKNIKTTDINNITLEVTAYVAKVGAPPVGATTDVYCSYPPNFSSEVTIVGTINWPANTKSNFIINITQEQCWNYSDDFFVLVFHEHGSGQQFRLYELNHSINSDAVMYFPSNYSAGVHNITNLTAGDYLASCQASDGYDSSVWLNSSTLHFPSATISIYNEMNLSYMNIANIGEVRLDVFCENRTQRIRINESVTELNLSCFYEYMNLWFVYNSTTSYYRTLIPEYGFTPYDVEADFYMIDLYNKTAVLWDVKLVDLIGEYLGQPFFVTKLTDVNGTIEVIKQLPDIQNYVHLYLIKDETYSLNIYSDDGRLRVIGNIEAMSSAERVATLPQISFKPEYYLSDDISIDPDYLPDSNLFRLSYQDSGGNTDSTRIRVYNGTDMTLIDTLNTTSNNFTYSLAIIGNQSYLVDLTVCHAYLGCFVDRRTYGLDLFDGLPDFSWLFANGTSTDVAKKIGGMTILIGTSLLFPIRSAVVGVALVLVELAVLPQFGLLEFNTITYSVFFVMLGITIFRKVIQKR